MNNMRARGLAYKAKKDAEQVKKNQEARIKRIIAGFSDASLNDEEEQNRCVKFFKKYVLKDQS